MNCGGSWIKGRPFQLKWKNQSNKKIDDYETKIEENINDLNMTRKQNLNSYIGLLIQRKYKANTRKTQENFIFSSISIESHICLVFALYLPCIS